MLLHYLLDSIVVSSRVTDREPQRTVGFGQRNLIPLSSGKTRKGCFALYRTDKYLRLECDIFVVFHVGQADDAKRCLSFPRKTNQNCHTVQGAIDEALCVIDWIDPYAELLNREETIEPQGLRRLIQGNGIEIEVNEAFIFGGLFTNDFEIGEEVMDASDEHSLYLVVSLSYQSSTYVTGSLTPFSYFFSLGSSAHSLAISQARKARWVTTDT
jgi:hypothetical protein